MYTHFHFSYFVVRGLSAAVASGPLESMGFYAEHRIEMRQASDETILSSRLVAHCGGITMLRIRRAIGLTLGDIAFDLGFTPLAAFAYYKVAMYPKRIKYPTRTAR